MVKNYMEIFVDDIINDMLRKDPSVFSCTCENCIECIKAISLNHIPPFYITCKVGEVFGDYQNKVPQQRADILSEIAKAIEIVAKNPRH
ncbi:MAG: late competence development ComFB family protein [Hydrogenoanaerobacterium sp.]